MSTLKPGATARLIQPEVKGLITKMQLDAAGQELQYLLEYKDSAGDAHQRFCLADELEVVEPEAPAEEVA